MTTTLKDLGWSAHFERQIGAVDTASDAIPARVTEVRRDTLGLLTRDGPVSALPTGLTGEYAVGDWVLYGDSTAGPALERTSILSRRAAGTDARVQLIAANVDTLFITSSCNADFNPARLERFIALAHEGGCFPVVVLTKADLAEDPRDYERRAEALAPVLTALAINAHVPSDVERLMAWCGQGQTAALVGSSGVGKTTLLNAMTGAAAATADIREDDAKGRHTTTARSLRPMTNGGWLIDTPGMRALRLQEAQDGIDAVFGDLNALAEDCRFHDCAHDAEPGCAIQAAIASGDVDPNRLKRWRKLLAEDARNSETIAQARARGKGFARMARNAMRGKAQRKGFD